MLKLLTLTTLAAIASTSAASAASYRVQWRFTDGGGSLTGWHRSARPVCGHHTNCRCGSENYCGEFRNGQTVKYFDQGCGEAPTRLTCDVRR